MRRARSGRGRGGTYNELERLDEADGLVDGAADGEVVDGDLAEDALGVNDEEAAEGDALVLEEDTVVARDLHVPVGDQRELQVGAETALVAGLARPGEVGVGRVGGDTWTRGERLKER